MISIINSYKYGNTGLDSIVYKLRQNPKNRVDMKFYHNHEQYDEIVSDLIEVGPYEVYGFSVFETNYSLFNSIAKVIKKINKDACIVMGRQFVTMNYEMIISESDNVDYYIIGDGESPFERLVEYRRLHGDKILHGDLNIAHKTDYLNKKINIEKQIDRGVVYDYFYYDTPERNMQKTYCMLTKSNVCTGNCSFCVSRKGHVEYISAEQLANKIEYLARTYGIRKFFLCDDDIFDIDGEENRARLERLIQLIDDMRLNIVFSGFAKAKSVANVANADILEKMSKIGFHHLFVGIDTGNEMDRKLYNKKSSLKEGVSAISYLRKIGIAPRFGMIFFNPFSSLESIRENFLYLKRIGSANYYHYGGLKVQLLYGTRLLQLTKDKGLLKNNYFMLNTEAYNFENPGILEIVDFLNNEFYRRTDAIKSQFITLKNKYELINHMDYEINGLREKVDAFEKIERSELVNYFEHLYVENNLSLCQKLLPEFIDRMERRTEVYRSIIKELDEIYKSIPLEK